MALRLLEVTVPEDRLERIPELVKDLDLIQSWEVRAGKGLAVARFLLEAEDVEALSDALVGGLGSPEGLRLILLPVEATLPLVKVQREAEETDSRPKGEEKGGKGSGMEAEAADAEAADAEAADGEVADGDAADGDAAEGEAPPGAGVDGAAVRGEVAPPAGARPELSNPEAAGGGPPAGFAGGAGPQAGLAVDEEGDDETGEEPPPEKPGPERISREELYEDVSQASKVTPVYLMMVALSSVVAAVGLLRGDVPIIIGAMVIAPLLGPNVALSLASTLGDLDLARRSMKAIVSGVAMAAVVSLLVGLVFTVDPSTPELAARTHAGLGDIVIALAAGSAGSLAFTSGVPAIVVGVMVAVALLPPLVVAGLLIGAGFMEGAVGALMLLVINVTCINLASVATFLVQRVRPRTWWETDRARKATRIAVATWTLTLAVLLFLIWLREIRGV